MDKQTEAEIIGKIAINRMAYLLLDWLNAKNRVEAGYMAETLFLVLTEEFGYCKPKEAGFVQLHPDQTLPERKPPCEHNWVLKGKRRETRNYGGWDVELYYCSKCLAQIER